MAKVRCPGVAAAVCAAAIAVTVGGCGGSGGHLTFPSGSSRAGASSPASSVPTGAQLARLLPPHGSLPPGWQEPQSDIASAVDSGAGLKQPIPATGPIPSSYYACDNWNLQLNPGELTFLWQASDASALVSPPTLPAPARFVSLLLAGYQPGDASKQLTWDTAFAHRCGSYRFANHTPVTVTATPETGLGDQSLYVQLDNPSTFNGQFLRARLGVLLVRVANTIIGISQAGTTNVAGDPTMPFTEFKSIASWLVKSVETATGST
jgi:hypothetical protein